jgi:hypothetical protein
MNNKHFVVTNHKNILLRKGQIIVIVASYHVNRAIYQTSDIAVATLYVTTVNQHVQFADLLDHSRHIIISAMGVA